jgi:hypothetical protein
MQRNAIRFASPIQLHEISVRDTHHLMRSRIIYSTQQGLQTPKQEIVANEGSDFAEKWSAARRINAEKFPEIETIETREKETFWYL